MAYERIQQISTVWPSKSEVQEAEVETAEEEELWVEIDLENVDSFENEVTTAEIEAASAETAHLSTEIEAQPRREKRGFKKLLKKFFSSQCCICGKKD